MSRINTLLLERLEKKLRLSRRRVYELVDAKVRSSHLPRHLAAIVLATEHGINISKFATPEDLATIRSGHAPASSSTIVVTNSRPKTMSGNSSSRRVTKGAASERRRGNSVFVVHGRNLSARDALFAFLRSVGLKPIEWTQAIKMTGQPSPYVGTILETAFKEAAAVVVLFTPDDEARLRDQFQKSNDPDYEKVLTGQARPNVLFEAGMAFGKNPNNTVLIQIGDMRPFSDIAGRHIMHLGNDAASRKELLTKLSNAGCTVDDSGTDWLSTGDFTV